MKEQLKALLARLAELGANEDLSDEELKELETGPARAKALRVSIESEDLLEAEEVAERESAEKAEKDRIANMEAEAKATADAAAREEAGVPFACTEGVCGTCIVEVLSGNENLSEPTEAEIDFLGEDGCTSERMACQCRLKQGTVEITF